MKILDNHKDYYDYMVGIYGIDEKLFYDRRGSIVLSPQYTYDDYSSQLYPKHDIKHFNTDPKVLLKLFSTKIIEKDPFSTKWNPIYYDTKEGNDKIFWALQCGKVKYVFKIKRVIEKGKVTITPELFEKMDGIRLDYSDAPMYMFEMWWDPYFHILTDGFGRSQGKNEQVLTIDNPILKDTYVTGFISPYEIWMNLSNYLSSQVEKPFVDSRTNKQHIESAGFDNVTSFRNVK